MMIASRSDGYSRYSHTPPQAIDVPQSHSRWRLASQNRELLAREEIFGLKPRAPREPRPDGKQQLGQKRDHRPLHYHAPTRASSPIRFSGGTGRVVMKRPMVAFLTQLHHQYARV